MEPYQVEEVTQNARGTVHTGVDELGYLEDMLNEVVGLESQGKGHEPECERMTPGHVSAAQACRPRNKGL